MDMDSVSATEVQDNHLAQVGVRYSPVETMYTNLNQDSRVRESGDE
jgi:hypothetical protein